jgi:hypothetical protein
LDVEHVLAALSIVNISGYNFGNGFYARLLLEAKRLSALVDKNCWPPIDSDLNAGKCFQTQLIEP